MYYNDDYNWCVYGCNAYPVDLLETTIETIAEFS